MRSHTDICRRCDEVKNYKRCQESSLTGIFKRCVFHRDDGPPLDCPFYLEQLMKDDAKKADDAEEGNLPQVSPDEEG